MNSVSRVLFLSYTFTFVLHNLFSITSIAFQNNNNRKFCREDLKCPKRVEKEAKERERERGRVKQGERHFESSNYRSLGIHNNGPSSGGRRAPCMWMTQMHVTGETFTELRWDGAGRKREGTAWCVYLLCWWDIDFSHHRLVRKGLFTLPHSAELEWQPAAIRCSSFVKTTVTA